MPFAGYRIFMFENWMFVKTDDIKLNFSSSNDVRMMYE
jgi:hypothetical protein